MADAKIINYGQPIGAGSTAIPDNTSVALDIESTDANAEDYITIDTTEGSENMKFGVGASSDMMRFFSNGTIDTSQSNGYGIQAKTTASATAPVFIPNKNDPDTGIGRADADQLSLIAGGVEGVRIVESGGAAVVQFGQDNYDPEIQQGAGSNFGYTFKGDTNTGMTSGGSSDTLYLTAGSTQAVYISESGSIATTQINGPVSTVGAFSTQGSGTVGTGGSSSTTLEQASASTFQTELHVGAAIKIISGGVIKKATVASITDANTLELDSAETIANGSNWYFDSGELFAVKTGDSQTLFSVEPDRFLFESSNYNVVLGSNTAGEDLTTGDNNLFVGRNVGQNVTTGQWNTFIGNSSADGFGIVDPDRSVVIGGQAGRDCRDDNVYVGTSAGQSVGADQNVAIGSSAMTVNGPEGSVAIGYQAHKLVTGDNNVAVGHSALGAAGTAANCVALGASALAAATGNGNIGIGKNAGNAIQAGSSNICIGSDSDAVHGSSNQIAIGSDAVTDGANKVRLGNTSVTNIDGEVVFNNTSDVRTKANIEDLALGLDFINALRPVSFTRIHPAEYPAEILDKRYKQGQRVIDEEGIESFLSTPSFDVETNQPIKDEFDEVSRSDGLIAQEVKAVCDAQGVTFNGINENGSGKFGLQYATLVAPLIKAVQELTARIATLEAGD